MSFAFTLMSLLSGDMPHPDGEMHWFALRVKARHEKTVASALKSKGFPEFLPLYRAHHKWSDRIKGLDLPLFPGYVFSCFGPTERPAILATPGVASIVGFGKHPVPVAPEEIAALMAIVRSPQHREPWPFLSIGQMVRIVAGPLRGLEGRLAQVRDGWRVVINVDLLKRSVAVLVEREVIQPMHGSEVAALAVGGLEAALYGVS